jgi:hypothetical protein
MISGLFALDGAFDFDRPEQSLKSRIGNWTFVILSQPTVNLWPVIGKSVNYHDGVEFGILIGNSLIWGWGLAWLRLRFSKKK